MPQRRLHLPKLALALVLLVVIVGGLLAIAISISCQQQRASAELRYVSTDQTIGGTLKFVSTFWISNRSDAKILIALRQIETRTPQGWTIYTNTTSTLKMLLPGEAGQIKIDAPAFNGAWRVRLAALSEMKGLARYWTLAKLYWGDLRNRLEMGKAARPLPPLGGAIYGSTTELISADITD